MPKLPRKTVVQFGSTGVVTDFGQFGSKTAAAPQTSQDPTVLQQLAAWVTGWTAAAVGAAFNPYLEDMNGFCFVISYFMTNIFERGIPDWDAGTTYFQGAQVQDPAGTGQRWFSLTNNNLGNAPPAGASNALWRWDNPTITGTAGRLARFLSAQTLGNSIIQDDGSTVGVGGAPAADKLTVYGTIKSTTGGFVFPDNSTQTTAVSPAINNRQFARGTGAGGSLHLVAGVFQDLPGATLSITTTGGTRLKLSGRATLTSTGGEDFFGTVLVNGANQGGSQGLGTADGLGSGESGSADLTWITDVLPAGVYTVKIQVTSQNTSDWNNDNTKQPFVLIAEEIPA